MADKKISALTAATTPLAGTEVLPIVQSGSTVKVSVDNLTAGKAVSATSIATGLGAVGTPAHTFTGDTNTGMWSPAADNVAVSTAGNERFRVDSSGNVGIGTSAPGTRLDVAGGILRSTAASAFNAAITVRSDASASNWARLDFQNQNIAGEGLIYLENTGAFNIRNNVAGQPIRFFSQAAERMRITSAGSVGVNETAPDYLLDVNGTFGFTPGASVTPVDNGDVVFELTNNTTLTVKAKGSDGVVRSGTIVLV